MSEIQEKAVIELEVPKFSTVGNAYVMSAPLLYHGVEWQLGVNRRSYKDGNYMYCKMQTSPNKFNNKYSSIKTCIEFRVVREDGQPLSFSGNKVVRCSAEEKYEIKTPIKEISDYVRYDIVKVEMHIGIVSMNLLHDFSSETNLTNVCLVVEENKLHLHKHVLAIHSSVFKAMFFGGFKEENENEIKLEHVKFRPFLILLNIIYDDYQMTDDENIEELMIVADRFDVKHLLERPIINMDISKAKKLEYADKFDLEMLKKRKDTNETKVKNFNTESELTDIEIVVEGKSLFASKTYLAVHSPVFDSMFYRDAEKSEILKKIEIADSKFEEFQFFLNIVYDYRFEINNNNYQFSLDLAHRFACKRVKRLCETYLLAKRFELREGLIIADKFNLTNLKYKLIQEIRYTFQFNSLRAEFPKFEDSTKTDLLRRLREIL